MVMETCRITVFPETSLSSQGSLTPSHMNCMVCLQVLKDSALYVEIFGPEVVTEHSYLPLPYALSVILETAITPEKTKFHVLCCSCFSMVNEWDRLLMQAEELERALLELFHNSLQKDISAAINTSSENNTEIIIDAFPQEEAKGPTHPRKGNKDSDPEFVPYNYSKRLKKGYHHQRHNLKKSKKSSIHKSSSPHLEEQQEDHPVPVCSWCQKCFFSKAELSVHLALHQCRYCQAMLSHPSRMRDHLRQVHKVIDGNKPADCRFGCSLCEKTYTSLGALHNHRSTVHQKKTFVCSVCGQVFRHKRLLSVHAVRHQDKSFKCSECKSTFYLQSDLNKHVNQVHRKVRPYVCIVCKKSFCQRSVLNHHIASHTVANKTNALPSKEAAVKASVPGSSLKVQRQFVSTDGVQEIAVPFLMNSSASQIRMDAMEPTRLLASALKESSCLAELNALMTDISVIFDKPFSDDCDILIQPAPCVQQDELAGNTAQCSSDKSLPVSLKPFGEEPPNSSLSDSSCVSPMKFHVLQSLMSSSLVDDFTDVEQLEPSTTLQLSSAVHSLLNQELHETDLDCYEVYNENS